MAGSRVGAGTIEPVITAPDPITAAAANQGTLLAGIFLELTCAVCVIGIAMFMAPILKKASPSLAAGYLGFRTVEAVFCTMITIAPVTLIALSKMPHSTSDNLAAQMVILIRSFSVGLPLALFFCLGALCLYSGLLRGKLLPKFIGVWGLIAVTMVLVMNIAGQYYPMKMEVNMMLALPIILNEIFMGLWLIVKGFNKTV
jgi:hypothetical protein